MRELTTERLIIRDFRPQDRHGLHAYLSQAETVRFEPYEVFNEEESRQEALRRSQDANFRAVCLRDSGELIGNLYCAGQDCGTWEIGYVFNRNYWKQGYAVESAAALLEELFRVGVHRITAMCNPLNENSWRLLERLHMRREGHLKSNIYFKRDETGRPIWCDTYLYAVLAAEWQSRP